MTRPLTGLPAMVHDLVEASERWPRRRPREPWLIVTDATPKTVANHANRTPVWDTGSASNEARPAGNRALTNGLTRSHDG